MNNTNHRFMHGTYSHLVVRKVGAGRGDNIDGAVFIATARIASDDEIPPEGGAGIGGHVIGEGHLSGREGTVLK
jgi:cobalamin biosynthesis protein CbiD